MKAVHIACFDFGEYTMPGDLKELLDKAPRRKVWREPECECCGRGYWDEAIDDKTEAGKAYWKRWNEINDALGVIYCLGWDVVEPIPPRGT